MNVKKIKSVWILGSTSTLALEICIQLAKSGCKRFFLLARDIKHTKEEIQTSNICEKEKNGAAKTIRFLVHCFGLHANNRYFKLCS